MLKAKFSLFSVTLIWIGFQIFIRLIELSTRVFHHDESLHAYYSLQVAQGQPHIYDGMLHGPLLYHVVGFFQLIFGQSDFVARLPAVLCFGLLLSLPLFLKKYIDLKKIAVFVFLLSMSPTIFYFSRFLREDIFTLTWVLGTLVFAYRYSLSSHSRDLYLSIFFLSLHFCNKENSYLHLGLWLLSVFAIALFERWIKPPSIHRSLIITRKEWLICVLVFFVTYISLYSSFFRHPDGTWEAFLNGLYKKSIQYWWEQNHKRRIDGQFDYHFPIIANYEFLLIPFLFTYWWLHAKIFSKRNRIFVLTLTSILLATLLVTPNPFANTSFKPFADALHIKTTRHFLQIIFVIWMGTTSFLGAVLAEKRLSAFLVFWFTGTIGIYSYVGEKVPWLTVYFVLPMCTIAALEISRLWEQSKKKKVTLVFWMALTLPLTTYKIWCSSYERSANPAERLVFTHTDTIVKAIVDDWRNLFLNQKGVLLPKINVDSDSQWPFAWYVQDFDVYDFRKTADLKLKDWDLLLLNETSFPWLMNQGEPFTCYRIPLRSWWIPGDSPTSEQLLKYFVFGEVYSVFPETRETGIGSYYVVYCESLRFLKTFRNGKGSSILESYRMNDIPH